VAFQWIAYRAWQTRFDKVDDADAKLLARLIEAFVHVIDDARADSTKTAQSVVAAQAARPDPFIGGTRIHCWPPL
jgi:hypothetical protein